MRAFFPGTASTGQGLDECKAALHNPVGDRSITDIALAWGFYSLATIHRNFRQAFSVTPGELRGSAATPR
jgi:AraC-like DNA-binding protein